MFILLIALIAVQSLTSVRVLGSFAQSATKSCRTQPGDPEFPNKRQFSQFNSSIDGRLVVTVPSALFCKNRPGGCTDIELENSLFLSDIPGAMFETNWEQDYASHPPSLCFRNSTHCGQGLVPIYAVNATSAAHIQAGVRFAQKHNLRVAIKASGHDLLGRSTAKNSLLLWTRYFEDVTFHDSFKVGGKDMGSAVTAGSGVGLHVLYQACKAKGKVFVGGFAANVVAAGGYVQGAGHSPIAPLHGLGADNVLEFKVVIANGSLVVANEVMNPDLFWALRGGGPGSWGVTISATLRTFPTFDIVSHEGSIVVNSTAEIEQLATLHARHIFDWDNLRASQYVSAGSILTGPQYRMVFNTTFPNVSVEAANASLSPFIEAAAARGFLITSTVNVTNVNDAFSVDSDLGGTSGLIGSRLISSDVYRHDAAAIGTMYKKLLDSKVASVSHVLLGGQISENAIIRSAVHPKWRTAKTHTFIVTGWENTTPADEVEAIRKDFTEMKVPILEKVAGPDGASYSNEADVREPKFQTTFFGDYARLSAIKDAYDPKALFIVPAGVGSEKWDAEGLCREVGV